MCALVRVCAQACTCGYTPSTMELAGAAEHTPGELVLVNVLMFNTCLALASRAALCGGVYAGVQALDRAGVQVVQVCRCAERACV